MKGGNEMNGSYLHILPDKYLLLLIIEDIYHPNR
ncbi:hypothetical protein MHK_001441 [Candidatus Magnetomorum sp. HK-1]|nr:hypothetical protein MHK_001441 [Candidatus Magnetomorum sp. HK-1]